MSDVKSKTLAHSDLNEWLNSTGAPLQRKKYSQIQ